jgi:dodecin
MSVYKSIEIIAGSEKSWEDAASNAVKEASKTVKNITGVWSKDQSATVVDGKITEYRVNCKITFKIKS